MRNKSGDETDRAEEERALNQEELDLLKKFDEGDREID